MSNNLRILPTHQTTSNHRMSAVNSHSLSTALTVISANIEGRTASKASILSEMCKRECCHCLCLQETHKPTNLSPPKIAGMSLIVKRPHKYSSAILIRDELKVDNVYERVQGTVELINYDCDVWSSCAFCVQAPKRPVCAPSTRPQKFAYT